jgi:hypothetical protein
MMMSKYVDRILDEVHDNFRNHFIDAEEQKDFLYELIEELNRELEYIECEDDE